MSEKTISREVSISRWKKAQKAEAAAWKVNLQSHVLTEEVRKKNLELICKYTSLSEQELKHMRILEIGGPVVERAFDDPNIPPKLIIDPLFPFPRLIGQYDKSCHRVRGMGEYLPLPDKSIDLCWCANTIDHTLSPVAVLKEIRRVLDDQGILVISCDIFPTWTKPLFPILDILDTPHPHHFTIIEFRSLLKKQQFEIQKEFDATNFRISLSQGLKNSIAALLGVKYVYFYCTPVNKR